MTDDDQPEVQAAPVVKVARDLREILELHEALLAQAIHKACDPLMPGGLAMVSMGAVSSIRDWERRVDLAEHEWLASDPKAVVDGWLVRPADKTRPAYGEDEDPDWEPPLQTLLFWSEDWREQTGSTYAEWLPTVKSESLFLAHSLNWAWDNELHWDDFAKDIKAVRRRLENVLYDGDRAERTRVTCDRDHCERQPQLIRVYHERKLAAYICHICAAVVSASEDRDHCPSCWTTIAPAEVWISDQAKDRWKCPACKHRYDDDDYRKAHAKQLKSEGADKFVNVRDAIATLITQGRGKRTVRRWLAPQIKYVEDRCTNRLCRAADRKRRVWTPGKHETCPACDAPLKAIKRGNPEAVVEGYCDLVTHQTWVWWPTLWRLHQASKPRKRSAA